MAPPAAVILKRLVNAKKLYLGRTAFFEIWGKLRTMLYDTPEYKAFLCEVRGRCSHRCTKCDRRGRHVHHIIRVYDDPLKALDPDNATFLCVPCHKKEHKNGTGRNRRKRAGARTDESRINQANN